MTNSITLQNNVKVPVIGLGTYLLTGEDCVNAVKIAVKIGYRHIDTADFYQNHKEIALGLKNSERKNIFITSKVWYSQLQYQDVLKSCERILKELNTTYLDLLLIHWPNRNIPMKETFDALAKLYEQKKTRAIGVSNFTIGHLKNALEVAKAPICVNQVEFHPLFNQKDLWDFCIKHDIKITAFAPLARGAVISNETLINIADKYKKSPAQISLRWLNQKGIIAIPKATSKQHIKENLDVLSFNLASEDIIKIDNLGINKRLINPSIAEF